MIEAMMRCHANESVLDMHVPYGCSDRSQLEYHVITGDVGGWKSLLRIYSLHLLEMRTVELNQFYMWREKGSEFTAVDCL